MLVARFGDNGPSDEQFLPQPKGRVQVYVGPPVRCEVCVGRGRDNKAEITVVTDVDNGTFVSICRPCGRECVSGSPGVLFAIAENREYHA